MAGGPFAEFIPCMTCMADGIVTRAERVYDGAEDDHYVCARGHRFGVDWARGAPTGPQWPLTPEQVAAIEATAEDPPPQRLLRPDTAVRTFVPGSPTSPAAALIAWLATVGPARLRLPVALVRGDFAFSLRGARIGAAADALEIRLDDCALGVGLAERARQALGDAPSGALWLEGRWRGGDDRVFAVLKVGDPLPPAELAAAVAEIEAPADAP